MGKLYECFVWGTRRGAGRLSKSEMARDGPAAPRGAGERRRGALGGAPRRTRPPRPAHARTGG